MGTSLTVSAGNAGVRPGLHKGVAKARGRDDGCVVGNRPTASISHDTLTAVDPKRVELKISINANDARRAKKRLGLKNAEAGRATIWFCDQPGRKAGGLRFELADRDVIVRLRHKRGADSDTTIKYRREPPFDLPEGWAPAATAAFKVEGDWTVRGQTVAASLDSTVAGTTIDEAVASGPPLTENLFSEDQQRFAAALLAPRTFDLGAIRPLGPIHAWRWEEAPRKDLGNELGAEHWKADGLEFLELSIRVKFANAEKWSRKFAVWATDQGVDIASVSTTKTQAVLEHFARRLAP